MTSKGIGNGNDLVGRYFMERPNITFTGGLSGLKDGDLGRCHQFYDEFKEKGLGSIILVFGSREANLLRIGATLEMEPSANNRITLAQNAYDYFGNPGTSLSLAFTERDQATLEATRKLIRRICADLGATDVEESDLSWSHHHLGGCRMGSDPNTSVVDANLRIHESPNLYLASSGVFVTGGASHPTLAITALSHRLADHLTGKIDTNSSLAQITQ